MDIKEISEKIEKICLDNNLNEIVENEIRELCVRSYLHGSTPSEKIINQFHYLIHKEYK